MNAVLAYIRRVGIEFDTAVNVLTGGALGQTVSERAAYGAGWRPTHDPARSERAGEQHLGWCIFCRLLSWIVQPNHCGVQFTDLPTPWFDFCRAGIAFAALFAAIAAIVHLLTIMI